MRTSLLKRFAVGALLFFLSGCGPKVIASDALKEKTPRAVALLPVIYPSGIQRERVDYLRSSLVSELRNRGFVLLDDAAIQKICKTPECPEARELSTKYLVDGYFKLDLESIARNNFLAGYYNTIAGKLTFTDREQKDLLIVEHRESERGGLLFNSGQIIQGVLSQIRNSQADAFSSLADKFSQALVAQIPRPQRTNLEDEGAAVMINSVKLTRFNADADDICVSATPEAMAFLLLPGQRTGLREVSPGKYCSRLRLAEFPANAMSMASVEVRSPYGSSAREPLKKTFESCSLKGLVRVADNARMKTLVIACTQTAHTSPVIKEGCDNGIQRCGDRKFLIYRAASTLGPFTKVAEVQDLRWAIPKPQGKDESLYQVVAVDKNGNFSVPEAVEIEQSSATGNS